jgi:hypothetical protein
MLEDLGSDEPFPVRYDIRYEEGRVIVEQRNRIHVEAENADMHMMSLDDSFRDVRDEIVRARVQAPDLDLFDNRSSEMVDVKHPSGLIDYNLYLNWVRKGRDAAYRRSCMYLYDGADCHPFSHRDFQITTTDTERELSVAGPERKLLIDILPVPERDGTSVQFYYVLGFDMDTDELFVRAFNTMPEACDLWSLWLYGIPLYRMPIWSLYNMVQRSVDLRSDRVELMSLSATTACEVADHYEDSGMNIVIVLQFCQWIFDYADILCPFVGVVDIEEFKANIMERITMWQLVLERASYRAWKVLGEMEPASVYRRGVWNHKLSMDLFDYHESCLGASLHEANWRAPSQEVCNSIRRALMEAYHEVSVMQLETLFHPPPERTPTASEVIEEMKNRSNEINCNRWDSTTASGSPESSGLSSGPPQASAKLVGDMLHTAADQFEQGQDESHLQESLSQIINMLKNKPPAKQTTTTTHDVGTMTAAASVPLTLDSLQLHDCIYRRRSVYCRRDSGYAASEP